MEESLRESDKFKDDVRKFIDESRIYRAQDEVTQKFQVENIESLKNAVTIQNGRLFKVEQWKKTVEDKEQGKITSKENIYGFITLISTLITAIAVVWAIFKK